MLHTCQCTKRQCCTEDSESEDNVSDCFQKTVFQMTIFTKNNVPSNNVSQKMYLCNNVSQRQCTRRQYITEDSVPLMYLSLMRELSVRMQEDNTLEDNVPEKYIRRPNRTRYIRNRTY